MYKVVCRQSPGFQPHAILSISVGGINHEGDKLAATLEWAVNRFPSLLICISDSVQRYRHSLNGLSEIEAYNLALAEGEAWVRRNQPIFDQYPQLQFTRWEWWRLHPDFADTEDQFAELAVTNPDLKIAVAADAARFLSRNPNLAEDPAARAACEACVIEELAVHTLQARQYGGCRIYPGTQLQSMALIRSGMVELAPYGLQTEKRATITLERRKILQPLEHMAA